MHEHVVYPYTHISVSHQKEQNTDIVYSMDERGKHYTTCNKRINKCRGFDPFHTKCPQRVNSVYKGRKQICGFLKLRVEGQMEHNCWRGWSFFSGRWKYAKIKLGLLHNSVIIRKAIELYSLNGCFMVCKLDLIIFFFKYNTGRGHTIYNGITGSSILSPALCVALTAWLLVFELWQLTAFGLVTFLWWLRDSENLAQQICVLTPEANEMPSPLSRKPCAFGGQKEMGLKKHGWIHTHWIIEHLTSLTFPQLDQRSALEVNCKTGLECETWNLCFIN